MKEKTLIAGPWVGEFGWELFVWQAYVRSVSRSFERTVIICRENSKALYEDYADEFIFFDANAGLADSWFMHGLNTSQALQDILRERRDLLQEDLSVFTPRRIGAPPATPCDIPIQLQGASISPEYIKFGKPGEQVYDYIFHVRQRELRREDNWSLKNWEQLFNLLSASGKKIACIGTTKESGHIKGAEDLRDMELSSLFDVLAGAECAFGPSSGPMHLASLCGCPHVVWSIDNNHLRYTRNWNPLNTPVLFDSKYEWHPTADHVYEKFIKWRRE